MSRKFFEYAGFWKRVAASILDGVIIIFASSSLRWLINDAIRIQSKSEMGYEEAQNMSYIIFSVYLIFIRWAYFASMESSPLQATLGKLAAGLYVTNMDGERIGFGQASGRFFGKILSGLIGGIGFFMAGFTDKKQALHDQISNCLVLCRTKKESKVEITDHFIES